MAARQQHGFDFETKYCIDNNLKQNTDYTAKWDAVDEKTGDVYSMKCAKLGSGASLGDLFRQSEVTTDFYLILGLYDDDKNKIVKIEKWFVNGKKFHKLFEWNHYAEIKDWIRNKVSNDYSYDDQWKLECKEWKSKWNNIPSLHFKRSHKGQRRMQCSIRRNKFAELITKKIFTLCQED